MKILSEKTIISSCWKELPEPKSEKNNRLLCPAKIENLKLNYYIPEEKM